MKKQEVIDTFPDRFKTLFESFLASKVTREWLKVNPLNIYLRKSLRPSRNDFNDYQTVDCIDLGNVSILNPRFLRKGIFKSALEVLLNNTQFKWVYVENVLNPNLYCFLKNHPRYTNNRLQGASDVWLKCYENSSDTK